MSDTLRMRGEQMLIRLTRNGVLERTMTAIESVTWTVDMAQLQKGYLGETNDRQDDIYMGTSVELKFDPENSDAFTLIVLIQSRAQRRTAQSNAHINLSMTAQLPNGQRPQILIPDLKFGPIPVAIGKRDEYVGITLSAKAETFKLSGV